MKPARDAIRCEWDCCQQEAAVPTPNGPMCRPHANELKELLDLRIKNAD